jgi:hypothetical protein
MKEEIKYKFEPIWLIVLDLLFVYLIYITVSWFISHPQPDIFSAWMLSMFVLALLPVTTIIKLTFRMIRGLPAIIITESGIVDNVNGISIEWDDIFEIYVTEEGRFAGGNLVINLNNPEEFFGKTRLQFRIYKIRKYFTSADIAIKLSFVKGKNEDIVNTINTYWAQ